MMEKTMYPMVRTISVAYNFYVWIAFKQEVLQSQLYTFRFEPASCRGLNWGELREIWELARRHNYHVKMDCPISTHLVQIGLNNRLIEEIHLCCVERCDGFVL